MKKTLKILFTILVFISCRNTSKPLEEKQLDTKTKITQSELIKLDTSQTKLILQKILDLPIYHQNIKEKLPVKILESEMIEKKINLNKFGQKVRILTISELEKEGIKDYIIFDKLDIRKNIVDFELHFQFEDTGCIGKLIKQNDEWKVVKSSIWQEAI